MIALLREADAAFETTRKATLERLPKGRLASVTSIALALQARLEVLRSVPENLIDESTEEYRRALGRLEGHRKLFEKIRAEHLAQEAERQHGRGIARANATIGLKKVTVALEAERDRHNAATTSEREDARHEATLHDLALKLEGAMTALAAVSSPPGS
jgi:hypothetical protein